MVLKSPEAEFLDKQFFTSGIGVSVKYTAVPFTMSVNSPEQYPGTNDTVSSPDDKWHSSSGTTAPRQAWFTNQTESPIHTV